MPTSAPQTRHTVTAIIVAHDGARWLPGLVQAMQAQTYPVDQAVGVDTGSRDRSGAVLAELIGQDAVFGMDRSTGYGEAVTVALRSATRSRPARTDPGLNRIEWIWLLHDDCEPAPDALERLLRAASKDRSVVVLGPKVLDGQDRRSLREVGISIDRAGRRVTGIDPGEIDQGQHDHKKAVLAVGSAGMLVRRDIWDQLGGFDTRLRLFRDDLDFCWRVQSAGYRVQVVTDSIVYHRELSARRRRPTEGGNARRIDRRNALFVLAVNLPLLTMLRVVGGCVIGSLARAFYFLVTKQLDLAAAHAFAVFSLFAHPVRLVTGRRRRARGRADGYNAVRLFIPPARTLFRLAEKIAGLIGNGPPQSSAGRHHAATDESEEDEQFVDTQSVMRRFIGHPGVQLFAALLIVSLVAERRLLGTSPLGGGALVPAWGGAGALWHEYLSGFHTVGVGSTASAPPYLAVVAGLASILGGQAWLAVDVLLLGCVPLAGVTAYLASRWIVSATPARVLLAASYALLPVATGAVAAGRLGTAVAFIMLPLIAVSAGRMLTAAPRQAQRAAWATGLLIGVTAAFAPLAWLFGLVLAVGLLVSRRWLFSASPVNAVIVIAVPFLVLFPWSLYLLSTPSAWVSEVGVAAAGLTTASLPPQALFALSPGGPGLPPIWVTAGFALAVLPLLLSPGQTTPGTPRGLPPGSTTPRTLRRTELAIAGWIVAVVGFVTAVLLSHATVTPPAGGQAAPGWPGVALALAALGLLVAAAPAAQWLSDLIKNGRRPLPSATPLPEGRDGGLRRLLALLALLAAATAPVLVAIYWVTNGVGGPVGSIAGPVLPAFVSASSTTGQQYRTLILRPDGSADGGLNYAVVRQGDPTLGEPELAASQAASQALSRQVAALGAPNGADAGDPGNVLGEFGIRWVLLPGPVNAALAQRLDAAVGLVAVSKAPTYDLWEVAGPVARARVIAADGAVTPLPSNPESVSGDTAPAAGGTLVLAEPYGGWTASLGGRDLKPVATPVDGWAQGFVLPAGGGQLSISRSNLPRDLSLLLELVAVAFIAVCALPGKRTDPVEEAAALAALREARLSKRTVRAGRRPRVGHGRAGLGGAGLGSAGLDGAGRGSAGPGGAGLDGADLGSAGLGSAGLGGAGLGGAGRARPAVRVPALALGKLSRGRAQQASQAAEQDAVPAAAPESAAPESAGAEFAAAEILDSEHPAEQPDFGRPSFDDPGLDRPGFDHSGLDHAGFDHPGFDHPGFERPDSERPEVGVAQEPGLVSAEAGADAEGGDYASSVRDYASSPGDYASSPGGRAQASAWDMAGDWTGPSQPDVASPWHEGVDPWNDAPVSRLGDKQQPAPWPPPGLPGPGLTGQGQTGPGQTGPQRRAPWESGPQRPVSRTAAQPALPGSPEPSPAGAWDTGSASGAWDTAAPETSAWPAETQRPPSSTGSQPRYRRDSAPQEPASRAGAQPRYPRDPAPADPLSATGSQPRYPRNSGPQPPVPSAGSQPRYPQQPAPADPAPRDPASATGSQPRYPWDSAPQDQVSPTGSQPRYPGDSGPQSRVPSTGSQPRYPRDSGPQDPLSPTGSQPYYQRESAPRDPAASAGSQPRYPLDPAPQDPVYSAGMRPRAPGDPVAPNPVPSTGSQEWYPPNPGAQDRGSPASQQRGSWDAEPAAPAPPAGALPAAPARDSGPDVVPEPDPDRRPERQSHRSGKHGKPSRWHRSGGDGGS